MKKQFGFTMIEVMVALTLGAILTAGIGQLFVQSNNAFRKQRAQSNIMEDGRYVIELLAQEIRRAGYLNNPYLSSNIPKNIPDDSTDTKRFITTADLFPATTGSPGSPASTISLSPGQFLEGAINDAGFGSGNAHDFNHIVLRYQIADANDTGNSPCSSNFSATPVTDEIKTVYFFVADGVLSCKAVTSISSPTVSDRIPLISNVERLDVLYGLDTCFTNIATGICTNYTAATSPRDGFADSYVTANAVGANQWSDVVSIRITLILRSEDTGMVSPESRTITGIYTISDQTSITKVDGRDSRLYRAFNTTITTRNHVNY